MTKVYFDPEPLAEYITTHCITHEKQTLRSGLEADYYINIKKLFTDSLARYWAARALSLEIPSPSPLVGGVGYGGSLLVAAMFAYGGMEEARPFFVSRLMDGSWRINGIDKDVMRYNTAILIEDVMTTGGSAIAAMKAVRKTGCRINQIYTLVNREHKKQHANLMAHGVTAIAIFKARNLLNKVI